MRAVEDLQDPAGGSGFVELMAGLALAFQDDRAAGASLVEQIVAGAVAVLPVWWPPRWSAGRVTR